MTFREATPIRQVEVVLLSIAFFLVASPLSKPERKLGISTVCVFFGLGFVVFFPAPTE